MNTSWRGRALIDTTANAICVMMMIGKMCQIPTCGCRTHSLDDMISSQLAFTGYVNRAEETIINDYLAENNTTSESVWQAIKTGMENGQYSYLGTERIPATQGQGVTSAHKLCLGCGRDFFMNGPLYQWRTSLDPAMLPESVTSKEDCWYGRECWTQYSRPSHAGRLNHMCEATRRRP